MHDRLSVYTALARRRLICETAAHSTLSSVIIEIIPSEITQYRHHTPSTLFSM